MYDHLCTKFESIKCVKSVELEVTQDQSSESLLQKASVGAVVFEGCGKK